MIKKMSLFSIIMFFFFLELLTASPLNAVIRIMPLGNSITQGEGSEFADKEDQVAYRFELKGLLVSAGYAVNFVGSENTGWNVFADSQHEGLGGRRADEIRDDIYNWLVDNPAEIILLHVGTNDINEPQAPVDIVTEVSQILDQIFLYDSNITVILALIINRKGYNCFDLSTTTTFNNLVNDMALTRIGLGDRIEIVDMECGADIDYRDQAVGGDMYNGNDLHPVDSGYVKMADLWFSGFQAIQPVADAGSNQSVNEFDLVTLDGSSSSDHFGAAVSYLWEQQPGGSQVTLSDPTVVKPTFSAPDVGPAGETLTFQLTVTDPVGLEAIDTVMVTIHNPDSTPTLDSGGGGGGCFIATAAYGSAMEPHVKILRDFRDRFLITNRAGKVLVKFYYSHSPPLADYIAKHDTLRAVVRLGLLPLVSMGWLAIHVNPVIYLTILVIMVFLTILTLRVLRTQKRRWG